MKTKSIYLFACALALASCNNTVGPSEGPQDYSGVQYKFDGEHWEEAHGKVIDLSSMPDNPILEFKTTGIMWIENSDSENFTTIILDPLIIENNEVKNSPDEVTYYTSDDLLSYYKQRIQFRKISGTGDKKVTVRFHRFKSHWSPDYTDVTLIVRQDK